MVEYETLKVQEREDGISIITFNRPYRLNAINFQFVDDLQDYLNKLENNLNIRVVILTGEGRTFCSGLDLKEGQVIFNEKVPENIQKFKYLHLTDKIKRATIVQKVISQLMVQLRRIPQPIIAAIRGSAYGGGLSLALASDIRIAGESAEFCNAYIKIGLSGADCGSSYWLPRLIGFSRAAEFMYTGRIMDAKEADKIGLVSKIVPDKEILNEALNIAKQILNKSPIGVRFTKDALNMNVDAPSLESAIKLENRTQVICINADDVLEGFFATLEKREPNYDKW
ncbi:MAG: enoyl-CoA hydratase/isomerase family protein [Candidatus Lokiarchaeota archaeon]|nr:enoyl-CoA hydratase/isomerase family protein [Candidatus Lokiarchaeota archaeon]